MERLTPDVTYKGLPLSPAAWDAHLALLREFVRGPVSALRATTLADRNEDAAWIALVLAGVFDVQGGERTIGPGSDFQWDVLTLTPYGRIYARQRGITRGV